MSVIQIADERLNEFYINNSDFDILKADLLNESGSVLDSTTLKLLKSYQRLLRIKPAPEIAQQLLNAIPPGPDSAQAIAAMTEAQFVKVLPGQEEAARDMYKNAISIKAKIQLYWANIRDGVASSHYRTMRSSTTTESDRKILSNDIPGYQDMFGDLDYLDSDHCDSVLGPAAYVVDLMRIVDQHITEPNIDSISKAGSLTLDERRPDLAELELTCENTNDLLPSLQIINHILEERVKAKLVKDKQDITEPLQSLATQTYPFNLPFNFPLQQIRSYLAHLNTSLATIYKTFDDNELSSAIEYLELSQEEYNLLTIAETDPIKLSKLYGVADITQEHVGELAHIDIFLKQTGLSRTELTELLEQNLDKTELETGLAHNFYINQVLENNSAVQFKQLTLDVASGEVIPGLVNLTSQTLDRMHRFIRLAKKLNWSFTDLDWALVSIRVTEINDETIKQLAKVKQLQLKFKLPLELLCSFWYEMKTTGKGSQANQPQDLFDQVYNNPFKEMLGGDKFFRLQDEIKQIDLSKFDNEVETNPIVSRLLAALRIDENQLLSILREIDASTVTLTVEHLSQLFRTSQLLRLLDLTFEEYKVLTSFTDILDVVSLTIDDFIQITELAEWLNQSALKLNELDYIINAKPTLKLDIGYSLTDITEGMKTLWQLTADSLLKPADLIGDTIDAEAALNIFNKLKEENHLKDVRINYELFLNSSRENDIALVLDSAVKISEILTHVDQTDTELRGKQNQFIHDTLQQFYNRQKDQLKEFSSFFSIDADLAVSLIDYVAIATQPLGSTESLDSTQVLDSTESLDFTQVLDLTQPPDYIGLLLTPVLGGIDAWSDIVGFFELLSKMVILTRQLALTPRELQCITDKYVEVFGINKLSRLTISDIQTIDLFKNLIADFNDDKNKLVEYLGSDKSGENKVALRALADLTGWNSEHIFTVGDLHTTVKGIAKLKQRFDLSRHLGVNVGWFSNLINLRSFPNDGKSLPVSNWEDYQDAARSVKEITKAKYDNDEWSKVSEKIEGELNEHKRDVMTSLIVWKHNYENVRHLSQELLIDVETTSCDSVSKIKEATLAIQTYMHRCRMGLEPGVDKLDIPEIWWQWMMNYRVWEANRKVFLYPENYLDPSLRKIKTPLYKELEEELMQSEITQESVEKSYQNYFEKFQEIAQLKPAGGYRCTVENNSGAQDTLYLFGRTATEPYTYYYRECINPEAKNPSWKAWQKIDLVINAEQINACYAFNKLFIFWVEIVRLEIKDQYETKATIKYSFQQFGKEWIQPQTLSKDIVIEDIIKDYTPGTERDLWRKVTTSPIPATGAEPEKILTLFGDLAFTSEQYETQDKVQGSTLTIDLLQENTNVVLRNQTINAVRSGVFSNKFDIFPSSNILYDNYVGESTGRELRRGPIGYWPMITSRSLILGGGSFIPNWVNEDLFDFGGNLGGVLGGKAKLETVMDFPGAASRNVLKLDGVDDYVIVSNHPNPTKALTVSLWAKSSTKLWNSSGCLASKRNAYILHPNAGTTELAFIIYQNGGHSEVKFNLEIDLTKWHHYAGSFDGKTIRLYLDGKEVATKDVSNEPINEDKGPLFIGKDDFNEPRYFNGQIAEVSIWDVALSAEQSKFVASGAIPLITNNISMPHVSVSAIGNQPGWFTFDNGDEAFLVIPQKDYGIKQIDSSLSAVTEDDQITLTYDASEDSSDISSLSELKFSFSRLTTSTIRQLSRKMFIGGLDNLLTPDSQLTPELDFNRFSPSDIVITPTSKQLDFDGALGIYFREIFFHIPFLVANSLNSNQRFEEAQKWYHYIFNPTKPTLIETGLVGYWPMKELNGDSIHDRAGNNNGVLKGQAKLETVKDFPDADSRNVLTLDGVGDYVDLGKQSHLQFDGFNNYTIAAWIKPDAAGTIFSKINHEILGSYSLSVVGDGTVLAWRGVYPWKFSSNNKVTMGEWSHVAITYDGNTLNIYINGNLAGSQPFAGVPDCGKPVLIGAAHRSGPVSDFFKGQIAEVRIWNIALNSEKVAEIANNLSSERFWRFLPFRGNNLQKLQQSLANDDAIDAYNNNPFDPHAVARLRIGAYEKAIVMKYIDNLLDWGDQLFAQDNRESINQAALLYFLAYDLLGEKPENLGTRPARTPKTIQQINGEYQSDQENIPQFLIELENSADEMAPTVVTSAPFNDLNAYFCTPENEQFIAYWGRVEDRLYKIRHCMNIDGIKRLLAQFQPPIDPAKLVRAVAGGRTPLSVLSQLAPPVPNYRFDYMLERAKNLTSTLIQLGSSILNTLEKKDAEQMGLLRSSHERSILKLISATKEKQIEEAVETLASLEESKHSADKRYEHYSAWYEENVNPAEAADLALRTAALVPERIANYMNSQSAAGHLLPKIFGFSTGGMNAGDAAQAIAHASQGTAGIMNQVAGLISTGAQYVRRREEWELQKEVLDFEIKQIDNQINAQTIRTAIAEEELRIHNTSIKQAKEIEDFLKDKFSNQELYQWMLGRLSSLYYQTYKLALDLALSTQSAYQYELNKDDSYINFDYWDSLKKGLLSGESLMLGLNQLEKAYLEGNVRRLEIEKTISLQQLDPGAFQLLKESETGSCTFELSETLFDSDFPGHYCRQIKTIAISIPAVVGPYQNVNATLTQTANRTLLKPNAAAVDYLLKNTTDVPDDSILRTDWRKNQKIAISRGALDNGLFELNFFWDTRYLPFEGTGAVSSWTLSLPKANNPIDFDSISDVIIILSYTALDGGNDFRDAVVEKMSVVPAA